MLDPQALIGLLQDEVLDPFPHHLLVYQLDGLSQIVDHRHDAFDGTVYRIGVAFQIPLPPIGRSILGIIEIRQAFDDKVGHLADILGACRTGVLVRDIDYLGGVLRKDIVGRRDYFGIRDHQHRIQSRHRASNQFLHR